MHFIKKILLSLLAVILIIEEFLWDALTWLGKHIFRLVQLHTFEEWLHSSSRYVALVAFLIPVIVIAPLNFIAIACVAKGKIIRGIVIEIFAKLLATMLFARVFALTRQQLMSFGWFAIVYATITGWLHWAHEHIYTTHIYQYSKALKETIRLWLRRFSGF